MRAFWDVFWTDAWGLLTFALPMLLVSLPVSVAAAAVGRFSGGNFSWRGLAGFAFRGFFWGTITALTLSMAIEFCLTAEGFTETRKALRIAANWQLFLSGPLLVFLFSFFAARRDALNVGALPRRFSLRRLFAYQLLAASLFGWWTFTRRNEIVQRRNLLAWEILDRDSKALFQPLGWWVETFPGRDEVFLSAGPHYRAIDDTAFAPIAAHGSVIHILAKGDQLTDRSLQQLRGADRLRQLYLTGAQITDEGVAALEELPRLRYVEIQSPHLTKKTLDSLAKVRTLRFITISRAHVTKEDVAAFHAARPGVNVRIVE